MSYNFDEIIDRRGTSCLKYDFAAERGYPEDVLDDWSRRARQWAAGQDPADLPHLDTAQGAGPPREAFVFFIAAAKERNPAAARALIERL